MLPAVDGKRGGITSLAKNGRMLPAVDGKRGGRLSLAGSKLLTGEVRRLRKVGKPRDLWNVNNGKLGSLSQRWNGSLKNP